MYCKISIEPFPEVEEICGVVRKTVRRCADKRSIIVLMKDGSRRFTVDGKDILLRRGAPTLTTLTPANRFCCAMMDFAKWIGT